MIDTFWVRNVEIGTGMPKICMPVTDVEKADILESIESAISVGSDMIEWRIDYYSGCMDVDAVIGLLTNIRDAAGDVPVLATLRTSKDGGKCDIDVASYIQINKSIIASGHADIIDLEIGMGDDCVSELLDTAQNTGVRVLISAHDFDGTPPSDEMLTKLLHMQDLGADISKIAVMPHEADDVGRLLDVSLQMKDKCANKPFITISMGEIGVISRLTGELYGSCMTYAASGADPAPGQLSIAELRSGLESNHEIALSTTSD